MTLDALWRPILLPALLPRPPHQPDIGRGCSFLSPPPSPGRGTRGRATALFPQFSHGRSFVAAEWETMVVENVYPDWVDYSNDDGDSIDPDDEATVIVVEPEEPE